MFTGSGSIGSKLLLLLAFVGLLSLPATTPGHSALDAHKSLSAIDQSDNALAESFSSDSDSESTDVTLASKGLHQHRANPAQPTSHALHSQLCVYYLRPQGRAPPLV
ncbi:MAG TPA: hypothetical protein DIW43_03725 [Spongiibacteraceae bacterium]|nr:hypothetical protein [Spongiibacteraceae bacterium]